MLFLTHFSALAHCMCVCTLPVIIALRYCIHYILSKALTRWMVIYFTGPWLALCILCAWLPVKVWLHSVSVPSQSVILQALKGTGMVNSAQPKWCRKLLTWITLTTRACCQWIAIQITSPVKGRYMCVWVCQGPGVVLPEPIVLYAHTGHCNFLLTLALSLLLQLLIRHVHIVLPHPAIPHAWW